MYFIVWDIGKYAFNVYPVFNEERKKHNKADRSIFHKSMTPFDIDILLNAGWIPYLTFGPCPTTTSLRIAGSCYSSF